MAEADPLRKYVEAGVAFTQLTQARAEAIATGWVPAPTAGAGASVRIPHPHAGATGRVPAPGPARPR